MEIIDKFSNYWTIRPVSGNKYKEFKSKDPDKLNQAERNLIKKLGNRDFIKKEYG